MMQSVALFDSVVVPNDDEWELLPSPSTSANIESDDDQVLGDDSSYDYCDDDDISSLYHTTKEIQPTLDYAGNHVHSAPRFSDEVLGTDGNESTTPNDGDPKRQVGALLQDILDTVVGRHSGAGHALGTPMIVENDWAEDQDALEDSPCLDHYTSNGDDLSTASSVFSSERFSSSGDDKRSFSENLSSLSKMDLFADGLEQTTQRSRLSNKKRRKQLRLNKKTMTATAPTAATVGVSLLHMAVPPKNPSKAKSKKQVGIALQAIESYKQEVLQSNNKNKNKKHLR